MERRYITVSAVCSYWCVLCGIRGGKPQVRAASKVQNKSKVTKAEQTAKASATRSVGY
jgi:hypothetical protein